MSTVVIGQIFQRRAEHLPSHYWIEQGLTSHQTQVISHSY